MRKYRTGELPDVQQVSIAAVLGPLGKSNITWVLVFMGIVIHQPNCSQGVLCQENQTWVQKGKKWKEKRRL